MKTIYYETTLKNKILNFPTSGTSSGTRAGDISGTYSSSCTILNLIDTIIDMKSGKRAHSEENLTGRATCNHSCPCFVNGRELCNPAEISDNLLLLTQISLRMSNMVTQKFINVNVPEFKKHFQHKSM